MKTSRIKVGRKVCFSKDNKAELYAIVDIRNNELMLKHVRTGTLTYFHDGHSNPVTAKDIFEASPQQIAHYKSTCNSK